MFDINTLRPNEVPPHLAPLRYVLGLNQNKYRSIGKAKTALDVVPFFKLKPEHVTELAEGLGYVSSMAKHRKEKFSGKIAGLLTLAKNRLLKQ